MAFPKKPLSNHGAVPEGNNMSVDTSNTGKAKKVGAVPPQFLKPAAAAPKKPFPGAVKPFTQPDGENPPPMAKKPGKQDNNISAKIPMAPGGTLPDQLPSKPVRDPKKPPIQPVEAGVNDTAAKKKGNKK